MEPRQSSGIPLKSHKKTMFISVSMVSFIPSACFSLSLISPNLILLIHVLPQIIPPPTHFSVVSYSSEFLHYLLLIYTILASHCLLISLLLHEYTRDRERIMANTSESIHIYKKKKNPHRACTTWHRVRRAQEFFH